MRQIRALRKYHNTRRKCITVRASVRFTSLSLNNRLQSDKTVKYKKYTKKNTFLVGAALLSDCLTTKHITYHNLTYKALFHSIFLSERYATCY